MTAIQALVIMVIVASTTGAMSLADLGGCFFAVIGPLLAKVLILDEKTMGFSLIIK